MTTSPNPGHGPTGIRASEAEREAVATRLRDAAGAGFLTLAEADERQSAAYAAVTRDELEPLTADLPAARARGERPSGRSGALTPGARRRLAVHAAVAGF